MELKKALCEAASKLGYSQVKPVQEEVVVTFLSGRDVFVLYLLCPSARLKTLVTPSTSARSALLADNRAYMLLSQRCCPLFASGRLAEGH